MDNKILGIYYKLNQKGESLPNSWELSNQLKADHNKIVGALKSLKAGDYVKLTAKKEQKFTITKEGNFYKINY